MLDDSRPLRFGDLARPVSRGGIDHEDLVQERDTADHLPHRLAHDRPDRLLLVEGRQDKADGEALLFLQGHQAVQVGELGMMEVRFAEPALDPDRDGAPLLCCPVCGGERFRAGGQLVEGRAHQALAGLDHDHRWSGAGSDRLWQGAEQVAFAIGAARLGRGPHDHEVAFLRLPQDGVADVRRLAQDRFAAAFDVLFDERGESPFRLGADRERDARWDEVKDCDDRIVMPGDRVGEAEGQLRVGPAADRHEDPPDLLRAALLDDGDVARRRSNDFIDRR